MQIVLTEAIAGRIIYMGHAQQQHREIMVGEKELPVMPRGA